MTLPARLLDTTQADIDGLIADRVREGPHIDFKRELPAAWNNDAKHDLLSDATAFANAGGGDLVFGVAQNDEAEADFIVPQTLGNVDVETRRLQDFLLNLAEPRLQAVQVHAVPVNVEGTSGHVVIVRVPQSWVGPHRVTTNQHLYIRDGLRKRQVNMPEIRSLFLRSESQAQRVRDFRSERLSKVMTGETPYKLAAGPVLVLHVVALQAVLGLVDVDPVQYLGLRRRIPVIAARSGAVESLVNLDGAAGTRNLLENGTNGYTLLFRNGFIETTWVLGSNSPTDQAVLPGGAFEDYIAQFIAAAREEFAHWGLAAQAIAMLSVVDADIVTLAVKYDYEVQRGRFDRKVLAVPDVEIAGKGPAHDELKPLLDLVWQSAGFEGSPHYGEDGKWTGTGVHR